MLGQRRIDRRGTALRKHGEVSQGTPWIPLNSNRAAVIEALRPCSTIRDPRRSSKEGRECVFLGAVAVQAIRVDPRCHSLVYINSLAIPSRCVPVCTPSPPSRPCRAVERQYRPKPSSDVIGLLTFSLSSASSSNDARSNDAMRLVSAVFQSLVQRLVGII